MKYTDLLKAYLSIWNNRSILINEESAENALMELINRELNDENTHPRLRKSKATKFHLAIKRVSESNLNDRDKLALIRFYLELMES